MYVCSINVKINKKSGSVPPNLIKTAMKDRGEKKLLSCRYINYKICAEFIIVLSATVKIRLAENPPLLVWWIFCMVTYLTD